MIYGLIGVIILVIVLWFDSYRMNDKTVKLMEKRIKEVTPEGVPTEKDIRKLVTSVAIELIADSIDAYPWRENLGNIDYRNLEGIEAKIRHILETKIEELTGEDLLDRIVERVKSKQLYSE